MSLQCHAIARPVCRNKEIFLSLASVSASTCFLCTLSSSSAFAFLV